MTQRVERVLRRLDGGILGGTQPAMPAVAAPSMGISGHEQLTGTQDVSALGETLAQTPLIVPVRGHLDSIKRLLKGDVYIGLWVQTAVTSEEPVLQHVQGVTGWEGSCDFELSASVAR